MNKILYFDCETTGLNPMINDIIQLAMIIEIDGKIKEEINLKIQPLDYNNIEMGALKINKTTIEELKTYQTPREAFKKIISIFDKYINKYDKKDKFYPAGYNVGFDINFLANFFKKNKNNYLMSYIDYYKIDPISILHILSIKGLIKLDNFKLETVCNKLNIDFSAHDALQDIKATRQVIHYLLNRIEFKEKEKCQKTII